MAGESYVEQALNFMDGIQKKVIGSQQSLGFSIEEIGRPYRFAETVDPEDRAYRFLATRMNCVDIYPCNYALSYLYSSDSGGSGQAKASSSKTTGDGTSNIGKTIAAGAAKVQQSISAGASGQKESGGSGGGGGSGGSKSIFKYGIGYDIAMKRYRQMCQNYLGDASPPSAIRIYLTDDTTTTDGIQSQYTENFFQKLADGLSNALQSFTSPISSLSSSAMTEGVDRLLSEENVNTEKITEDVVQGLGLSDTSKGTVGEIVKGLKQGAKIILKGQKLALPKVWQSSSYSSSFSVSTKLFSPYGSPRAIKKYIIRPLVLILLMGMPQTDDMVSYGKPFAVTVRSWGTSFLTLAGITNITLQRGGADSVFNKKYMLN